MYKPKWLALGYTVPADPSRNRVYVWRALKKIGAQTFKPTMAILPNTSNNRRQFSILAEKIHGMEGEAWLLEMNFVLEKDNDEMESRFYQAAQEQYIHFREEIRNFLEMIRSSEMPTSEVMVSELKKIQKEYQQNIKEPDGPMYEQVESAMGELRHAVMGMRQELGVVRSIWGKIMGQTDFS